MNTVLNRIKDVYQEACVSLILPTHRTRPDNEKDPVLLKNLIKEAEERLLQQFDRKRVRAIVEKLNSLSHSIDHQQNLDSLLLFANEDIAEYTRLAVEAKARVVIDHTFATRDIIRALHQESAYYILVLSRQQARLIEAYNDRVVKEADDIFPLSNTIYTTDRAQLSTNKGKDILTEEFFNQVDKQLWEATAAHRLPVIVATESRNFTYFLKITDHKGLILGHIQRNRDDEKAHHIVPDAWKEVHKIVRKRNQERLVELNKAESAQKLMTDFNDIWDAIRQGRGRTLFVKRGYHQAALLKDGKLTLLDDIRTAEPGLVNDIIDEMIDQHRRFGGDTVFVEGNDLDTHQGLALILRY
jgi:hypothetical protein